MFKNAIIYRIDNLPASLDQVKQAMAQAPFLECGAIQEKSGGWVPPRGEAHGALVESIGGQWIARWMVETKTVPGDVLRREVDACASAIEAEVGRKPGKRERKEIQGEALLSLLPMAFAKRQAVWVWIDPQAGTLVLDTTSQARADEVVTSLAERLPPGFDVALLNTQWAPQAAMAHWLASQEPPADFTVDRACELKSSDESKAVVRYGNHPLDIREVLDHINAGLLPTRLALTWDDRVSFTLTQQLQIKGVEFLEAVFDSRAADEDGFDVDVAIATGELRRLIGDLVKALGGQVPPASAQVEAE